MSNIFYKIVFSFMFIFLIIALVISLTGFKGPIQLDNTYYNFLQRVALEYESFHISIPDIPTISVGQEIPVIGALIDFVNFLVGFLNVIVLILNKIIEVIQFIIALIRILFDFGHSDFTSSGALSWWYSN